MSNHERKFSWSNPVLRSVFWQFLLCSIIIASFAYLIVNVQENLEIRQISFGYDFLTNPTGFDIGESITDYNASQNYYAALFAGFTNTLRIAILGIILATIIGGLVGIGALSRNPLLSKICNAYVETFRNIPLLIQLSMWYFVVLQSLPSAKDPLQFLPNVYLSIGGMNIPWPEMPVLWLSPFIGIFVGIVFSIFWFKRETKKTLISGVYKSPWPVMLASIFIFPLIGWLIVGAPTAFELPRESRFGIAFGASLSSEYLALLFGLTLYTAAFIAEVVRAGIQAVPNGQSEAASALGLSSAQRLRFVVLPQAMRIIVPPLTNQFLNLTKNSSLAVAIGYPDLVGVAHTTLNQAGRAIEVISILMIVYLSLSLSTSLLMQWFEAKTAIKER